MRSTCNCIFYHIGRGFAYPVSPALFRKGSTAVLIQIIWGTVGNDLFHAVLKLFGF